MISGHGNIEAAVKATKLGAFDFLEKPLSIEKVSVVVKNALAHRQPGHREQPAAARQRRALPHHRRKRAHEGAAPAAALMAGTNGRVLIYGESGTGKELVAHAIHAAEPARRRAVRRGQLRRHSRGADRERAVRPRQGQLHRRAGRQDRQVPEGRRRHAVPGRSGRHEPAHPGQGAARARGAALRAGRRGRIRAGGRARGRRHQQEPGGGDRARQLPRGPVLPPERDPVLRAAAARAARGHPAAGRPFPARVHHGLRPQAQGADARKPIAGAARSTTGRATCAS